MTTQMTVSETLYKAADLIEERGWAKGYGRVGVCLETALACAQGYGGGPDSWEIANTCEAGIAMRNYLGLGEWNWDSNNSLWNWNDRWRRSPEQVIEALRAAAVIEAAKESADDRERVTV